MIADGACIYLTTLYHLCQCVVVLSLHNTMSMTHPYFPDIHHPAVTMEYTPVDSFTVSLHSPNGRHLPAVRAVQGDCQWPLKNGGNSRWSWEPKMHCDWGIPNYIEISQSQKGDISQLEAMFHVYSTDSLTAAGQGLCCSLILRGWVSTNYRWPSHSAVSAWGFPCQPPSDWLASSEHAQWTRLGIEVALELYMSIGNLEWPHLQLIHTDEKVP